MMSAAFIVANTIKLAVYARRDEIAIQRLVGATRWFVRTPFLIEGAAWGLFGGLLAALIMWVADLVVAPELSRAAAVVLGDLDVRLFAPDVAAAIVGLGVVLGLIGSALAVRRFLDAVPT
jgi:cell division transport system permease protein